MNDVVALDEATVSALQQLFEACGNACFCRFWHYAGNKNEWLERCASRPEDNRDEQLALVRRRAPEARGLVALRGPTVIGWMKLCPRSCLPKLLSLGAYRPLALGLDLGVWSVGCLLVRPERRRQGVARALINAASAHARAWSDPSSPARMLEAYPRGEAHGVPCTLNDEEAWLGTQRLFESCGFARAAGEPPYPVMRKAL